jgi:hypothetical protein
MKHWKSLLLSLVHFVIFFVGAKFIGIDFGWRWLLFFAANCAFREIYAVTRSIEWDQE